MNRKIKITEPGWEGYTGNFGHVDFVDAVSTREVDQIAQDRIGGLLRVETLDGETVGAAQRAVDNRLSTVAEVEALERATEAELANEEPVDYGEDEVIPTESYTAEQLEAVASEDGIGGLRKIADTLGVRGRSINDLIAAILKAQALRENKLATDAAPAAPAAPEVPEAPAAPEVPETPEAPKAPDVPDASPANTPPTE